MTLKAAIREERPIGFWIKAADRALDAAIDAAHGQASLDRRSWQVLNTIARSGGASDYDAIVATFHPMLDASEVTSQINALTKIGLLIRSNDAVKLTEQGQDTHKRVASTQELVRRKVMRGIGEAEYGVALTVLKRIAANLQT